MVSRPSNVGTPSPVLERPTSDGSKVFFEWHGEERADEGKEPRRGTLVPIADFWLTSRTELPTQSLHDTPDDLTLMPFRLRTNPRVLYENHI